MHDPHALSCLLIQYFKKYLTHADHTVFQFFQGRIASTKDPPPPALAVSLSLPVI